MSLVLALDQGTTSSRAILFGRDGTPRASAQQEFRQIFPQPGWVEHDPTEIWATQSGVLHEALAKAGAGPRDVAAIGITNQRETTVLWERATGRPVHNAIVWQDRRTAPMCDELRAAGLAPLFAQKTGLVLDAYFSGTKLRWLLDHVDGARARAARGELAFGTIDAWLVWNLTGGRVHCTDASNASRTLLFDIHTGDWDDELLELFSIPRSMLPRVQDCASDFGVTRLFGGEIRILGMAGDQQAAAIGQGCFQPGLMKSTYGTGCFALLNTGTTPVASRNRLLTTVAYQLGGERSYALEGAIFIAGAAVQWLRDALKVIAEAPAVNVLAAQAEPAEDVYLVPAFVGLGAPYWDAHARGAIFGLTRNSGVAEIARATLESVGYQTRDLLEAMRSDWPQGSGETVLRVDGGMTASDATMQFLADILNVPVDRPAVMETTALGAAYLAGLQGGVCPGIAEFGARWASARRFTPDMHSADRERKYAGWRDAVARTLTRR